MCIRDSIEEDEMYRTFNMGVGMVLIVDTRDVRVIKNILKDLTEVFQIGTVLTDHKGVSFR